MHSSTFFLFLAIFSFETLFLWLEVGIKFKALHNKINTKCSFAEIHQRQKLWLPHIIGWKSIHYFSSSLDIPLRTTEKNPAHMWIMLMMRLELRTLWFLKGNITTLAIQTCMSRKVRFPSRNHGWNLNWVDLNEVFEFWRVILD